MDFVDGGLAAGVPVRCVLSDTEGEGLRQALRDRGVDLSDVQRAGGLVIESPGVLVVDRPDEVPAALEEVLPAARKNGEPPVQLVVEVTTALTAESRRDTLTSLEARLDDEARAGRLCAMCIYDPERLPAEAVLRALRLHPWVACEGPAAANPGYWPAVPDALDAPMRLQRRLERLRHERWEGGKREDALDLYRSLVLASPDAVTATDLEGRITLVSDRTLELHGYDDPDELLGRLAFQLIAPEEHEAAGENMRATLERGHAGPLIYTLLRRDGSTFVGEMHAAVVRSGGGGAPAGFVATVRDITERHRAHRALRESEERYRTLVEQGPDPVVLLQDDRFQFVSHAFTTRFGYTREDVARGLGFFELVVDEHRAEAREHCRARLDGRPAARSIQMDLITRSAERVSCEARTSRIHLGGRPALQLVLRDVTARLRDEAERRELDARVQEAQRLESLALLAGGVAHDFNNILVGILGNAQLVRRQGGLDPATETALETIEVASRRAAELCEQLLTYAGRAPLSDVDVVLAGVVEEVSELLRVSLPRKVTLRLELLRPGPTVSADATQLRQVVMNLIGNAADAIGEAVGRVVLRTGTVTLDAVDAHGHGVPPGEYAFVEVEDDGAGMSQEVRTRAFEPFFTTKRRGRGLGLAAVHGFLRAHAGAIEVESVPAQGSRFRILLPVAAAHPSELQVEEHAPEPERDARGRTVLVVDDEEMVRGVVARVLARAGFRVREAGDGEEALACFESGPSGIDAVFLDLNMPNLSGEEVLERLRARYPELPVVVSTGYLDREVSHLSASDARLGFVQKPFRIDEVVDAIYAVLGE